jgi:hypothetical protein
MAESRGLVPHVQQGNGSLFGWFNNPASKVSSHLWISKTGVVEQYVDLRFRAWAQASGNPYWHSVEVEGYVEDDYTPAQIQALAELYAWGMANLGWTPSITDRVDGRGLGTHRMGGAAWGAHSCPGDLRASRRVHILAAAVALLDQGDDMPLTQQDADLVVDRMVEKLGLKQAVPIGQTSPGSTIGETLRTVQFLVNSLGMAGWTGGQPTLLHRVLDLVDEQSRMGEHLGSQGELVRVLNEMWGEVRAIRADLAQRAANGADLGPVLARLDTLSFMVVPSAIPAPPTH